MARASKVADKPDAAPREADRLAAWPHPREMPELFGHAPAERELLQTFLSGHLQHAWLITGQSGIGKATLAYRFARFVLASGELASGELSEGELLSGKLGEGKKNSLRLSPDHRVFRQVASLAHPGLFVLRRPWAAAGDKFMQVIPVEEVRRLRHFLSMTAGSAWRAVIVDTADDFNISSANALLKMLEEPPARTVFLIVSSSPAKLFPTIRSRCARLQLRPLGPEALRDAVKAACTFSDRETPSDEEIRRLASLANGSPRRALELLDEEGLKLFDRLTGLMETLPDLDYGALHRLMDQLSGKDAGHKDAGQNARLLLDFLDHILCQAVRAGAVAPSAHQREGTSGRAAPVPLRLQQLIGSGGLALWAELWETIGQARAEAERLNLDRSALLLTVFSQMEKTARRSVKIAAHSS